MREKCLCGHNFNNQVRGPIGEMRLTSRLTLEPQGNRLNCKDCDCPKYRTKRSRGDKFWNGSE